MRYSFNILFYIKRRQPLKSGNHSILCRITFNGLSCVFSTGLSVKLTMWDCRRRRVRGRNEEAKRINQLLEEIRFSIYEAYMRLRRDSTYITPQEIKSAFWGRNSTSDGVLKLFEQHNQEFGQMVGVSRCKSTLYKYRYVCNHLKNFITAHYHSSDIPLNRVDVNFIRDFHGWLIKEVKCGVNTTWLYMLAFKHILTFAVNRRLIATNPFCGYRLRSEQTHRNFLMKQEIKRMIDVDVENPTEALVRDAFIFSCFTGLSYSDIKALRSTDIIGEGSNMYIAVHRIKTHTSINIPLLRITTELIRRYNPNDSSLSIFPIPSNYWCNTILAKLTKRAKIAKRITFHVARHTFATTVTLSQGIPIEVVSSMLGHTNIKTTQTYAKVLQCVTNSEMNRASRNLNSYFDLSSQSAYQKQKVVM